MDGKTRWWLLGAVAVGLACGVSACLAEAPDTGECTHFVGGFSAQQQAPHQAIVHARESLWKSYRSGAEGCTVLSVFTREGESTESIVRFKRGENGRMNLVLTVRDTKIDRQEGRRITAIAEFYPAAMVRLRRDGDGTELSRDEVADGELFVLRFVDSTGQVLRNQGI